MALLDSVVFGLSGHVHGRLPLMVRSDDGGQVGFAVLSAICEGDDVVDVPRLTNKDKPITATTPATSPEKYPKTNPIRDSAIIVFSYPFF